MPNASAYNPDPIRSKRKEKKKKGKRLRIATGPTHVKSRKIEKTATQRSAVQHNGGVLGCHVPATMPSMYPIPEYRPSTPQSAAQPEMVDTVKA
jgi:hypothetical protein